ncbi:hypothetical protein EYF80_055254 [Liparis tanakae]|uniref:Uncharacterized protein n=1 Tax=Liparis tanakae TaxID=230148 RepID=A0A4Z2F141_9TELE|nr:hypothetical protein EYF80_055254 [Liparis tanakae]
MERLHGPSPERRVQSPEHRVQSTEPRAPSPERRVQSTESRAQSTESRAPSPEHRAQSAESRAPSPDVTSSSAPLRGSGPVGVRRGPAHTLVVLELREPGEAFAAGGAAVLALRRVHRHVRLHAGLVRVPLAAGRAGEGLLARVRPHVDLQVRPVEAAQAALGAEEGLLARAALRLPVVAAVEPLAALGAPRRLRGERRAAAVLRRVWTRLPVVFPEIAVGAVVAVGFESLADIVVDRRTSHNNTRDGIMFQRVENRLRFSGLLPEITINTVTRIWFWS